MCRLRFSMLLLGVIFSFCTAPVRAEHGNEQMLSAAAYEGITTTQSMHNAKITDDMLRQPGFGLLAQQEESSRKKEEQEEEAGRRKEAEEDARLAPSCDPLKNRVLSTLNSAGTTLSSFNQALAILREIEKQLPDACPKKIQVFGGTIVNIVPCYNKAIYVELTDGGRFVWTEDTRTFNYGRPQAKDEFIMGLTVAPYFCITSVSPNLIVWPAIYVSAMARRKWDDSDRDRTVADRARARARVIADLDREISELDQKILRDPKDGAVFHARGYAYHKKGDYVHAIADFDKVINLQPRNAVAWNDRCGTRAVVNRELQQALADCNESLRLEPNNANTLDSRGFVYLRLGELDRSIADYDAALKVNSELASSLYGRGLAKQKKSDRVGSAADIAAAKKINANIVEEFAGYGIK